jgi:hypothetical protein
MLYFKAIEISSQPTINRPKKEKKMMTKIFQCILFVLGFFMAVLAHAKMSATGSPFNHVDILFVLAGGIAIRFSFLNPD